MVGGFLPGREPRFSRDRDGILTSQVEAWRTPPLSVESLTGGRSAAAYTEEDDKAAFARVLGAFTRAGSHHDLGALTTNAATAAYEHLLPISASGCTRGPTGGGCWTTSATSTDITTTR
jgi:hypothetical protein